MRKTSAKILARQDSAAAGKPAARSLTSNSRVSAVKEAAEGQPAAAPPSPPAAMVSAALKELSRDPSAVAMETRRDAAAAKKPAAQSPNGNSQVAAVKAAAEGQPAAAPPSPTDMVSAALRELGYDPSKFTMEMRQEKVEYPGGSYMHSYTHVELPNGLSENFATDLMARYPAVTANEIKRLMENRQLSTAPASPVSPVGFNGGT